jgi:hypothetical protein
MPRRPPAPGDHYNSVRDPASPGTSASGTSASARERRPPHGKPRATGAVSEAASPEAEAAAGAEAGGLSETMDGLRIDAPREGGGGSDGGGGGGGGGGGEDEGADGEGGDDGGGDEARLSCKQDRAKLKEEKRLRKEERHKRRAASEKAESEETATRTDWSSAVISL